MKLHSLSSSMLNTYDITHPQSRALALPCIVNHLSDDCKKNYFFSKGRKNPYAISSKPTKMTVRAQKDAQIIDKKIKFPTNMDIKLQEKPVQEIVVEKCNNNFEIPEEFIHKDGVPQANFESLPYMDDLVIDFSLLTSSSFPEADQELRKFHAAVTQWGCFQAINHGMSDEFIDKVFKVGKQFFALPIEEKQKYTREIKAWEGYGNDNIFSEGQTLDWLDRLYLTVHPEERRKLQYWPHNNPPEFRETLHEYTMKLRVMFDLVLKVMARSLNIEENAFLNEHGDVVTMFARYNFYPPCPNPENVLGLKPHADGVTITFLLQDKEVEGLQVLKDDQWYRVPIVPNAIFVNVGDILAVMSNGTIKSPVHRAVTNSERERMTLVMFCYAELDREMGPLAELITAERPQMYKRVKNYEELLVESYVLRKRPLHALSLYPTE